MNILFITENIKSVKIKAIPRKISIGPPKIIIVKLILTLKKILSNYYLIYKYYYERDLIM
jgi:hypothetical protein